MNLYLCIYVCLYAGLPPCVCVCVCVCIHPHTERRGGLSMQQSGLSLLDSICERLSTILAVIG